MIEAVYALLATAWLVFKSIFLYVGLPYFFYTRIWVFYQGKWHYERQGVQIMSQAHPFIGNLYRIIQG